jgi:hypothetical protein
VYDRVRSDLSSFKKADGDLDWELLKENPAIKDIIQEKVGGARSHFAVADASDASSL